MIDGLLATLVMASVVSIGLLFLPAFIELKKTHDAGPRIMPDPTTQTPIPIAISNLFNSEDELKSDR